MAIAAPLRRPPTGSAVPRLAPPLPAVSLVKEYIATAKSLGIELYPWQVTAARYITAIGPNGKWLYPEVAIIVARQNGKTELLKPLIVGRLQVGRKIMHTAQNRDLPRDVHSEVSDFISIDESQLKQRNGRPLRPRFANGQEGIELQNGGLYRIVAPTRGGARGPSSDLVLIDELREMKDHDFISAAEPTLLASDNPQIVYLSNAGENDSVVLNALQQRATEDPNLACLEWSAADDREPDDREGWLEANPSVGYRVGVMEYLERKYESHRLAGTMNIFETEHLCRSVSSIVPSAVTEFDWRMCRIDELAAPDRPSLGVALDQNGKRASAALAWKLGMGYAVMPLLDVTDGLDVDLIGDTLRSEVKRRHIRSIGYSGFSDMALSRYLTKPTAIDGRSFASASANFAALVESNQLHWSEADELTQDLRYTVRRSQGDGAWIAARSDENRPITAALAAIRAVWLASAPKPPAPRIG